ncbi:response regulator [Microbacterium sp. W4I20]|uniref:response regulator n=1 Tax=Microbacterium sp. W4I20 TaxID=3042262 RepID=UPI002789A86F|nr:response regulator [Microbacterium sp. W4I20]MDQ0726267.1 LmbE family N-acetylglucosaminyl deacetylase/CheY-like chemotaxis protein [Microbacterium sp. W4I20]
MAEETPRVLVVDDDPDVALLVKTVLERRAGCIVEVASDGQAAIERVAAMRPDVVVTDIEMPGLSGLELLAELRRTVPSVPVIVMTAHVSVEYAVSALRAQADEFLTKPLDNAKLVEAVTRLVEEGRRRREEGRPKERVLAIGAHPDDVEIGVGGLLAAHAQGGDEITILTLSRGARGGDADSRQGESLAAADMLGARLFVKDLVDTEISGGGATVRLIEEVVREIEPTIVYTHSSHDRHQDHRAVSEATIVATRRVGTVACYQSPSATIDFRPTRFVRIDQYLEQKLQLLERFRSQTASRDYLEPGFVTATARYWSRFGGGMAVEPLEVVRETAEFVGAHELTRRES